VIGASKMFPMVPAKGWTRPLRGLASRCNWAGVVPESSRWTGSSVAQISPSGKPWMGKLRKMVTQNDGLTPQDGAGQILRTIFSKIALLVLTWLRFRCRSNRPPGNDAPEHGAKGVRRTPRKPKPGSGAAKASKSVERAPRPTRATKPRSKKKPKK
jgi:hypothetical protein